MMALGRDISEFLKSDWPEGLIWDPEDWLPEKQEVCFELSDFQPGALYDLTTLGKIYNESQPSKYIPFEEIFLAWLNKGYRMVNLFVPEKDISRAIQILKAENIYCMSETVASPFLPLIV